jgi:protein involved in polysaccharide export with SLBB domain
LSGKGKLLINWNKMNVKTCTAVLQTTCVAVVSGFLLLGCNSNAWMGDPNAQGYYKPTPTTIPILDRIDIIEEPDVWPRLSKVTPMDLMPSDLTYRIHPGDVLDLKIFGLYQIGQHYPVTRRVDISGYFRVPEAGNVLVAGLTVQGAQDLITSELGKKALTHPSAQLEVIDQTALTYTVYGGLSRWGLFTLHNPDLRLVDVLALAGGVPQSTQEIYVIRQLEVSDTVLPSWDHSNAADDGKVSIIQDRQNQNPVTRPQKPSVNIEDLIQQLDLGEEPSSEEIDTEVQQTVPPIEESQTQIDAGIDALIDQLDIGEPNDEPAHSVSPGIIQTGNPELIDIDDLVPARNSDSGTTDQRRLLVDIDDLTATSTKPTRDSAFIYVPESDTWIPVSTGAKKATRLNNKNATNSKGQASVVLERIIEIPWGLLKQGDSRYNIVIRPKDRVYVKGVPIGNLYIRGEIGRPGVYEYPRSGKKITLSEFITSAGDLGPIAVPEKVSLTRRFGDVQATVTLNYAAILQRTEPDIFMKPNDHISIGTSWGATPMAIIRNGFRATYGFGFLLDRNFGNDVFGRAP